MAQVRISSDNRFDRPDVSGREAAKTSRDTTRTSAPSGPALSGDGLELVRSSHC